MKRLLTAWIYYLRIRHPAKRAYDLDYPVAFAIIVGSVLLLWPHPVVILGQNGVVATFNGLLGILIGFYIAALAAVATFQRPEMDEVMRGTPPTLPLPDRSEPMPLTRRLFLCLLFGHLTLVALLGFVVFALANALFVDVATPGSLPALPAAARFGFVYFHSLVIGHILSVTLFGVHYLAWRGLIADKAILD